MNLTAFFERIHYSGSTMPTLSVLTALQRQFLLHVPFENLYIRNKTALDLSHDGVFEKIVLKQRGGVCFEANALFHDALQVLGFDVTFIGAEMNSGQPLGGMRNHMALIVTIASERYLVDVGNGRDFGEPKRVDRPSATMGEDTQYKVDSFEGMKALYRLNEESVWEPRYIFSDTPWQREDFSTASHFVQTSPESWFTQKTLVSLRTNDGRMTLSDGLLIHTVNNVRDEKPVSESESTQLLKDIFGLSE
ncbi:arylamine N-acetyltransferase [Photobacterium makurazakiensis]|uniref:arylamine N-acetyltransferase family protein n=1 Tax=Photobacterium makurazakiensis TaxID=2910234 RepID=UPI003D0DAD4D